MYVALVYVINITLSFKKLHTLVLIVHICIGHTVWWVGGHQWYLSCSIVGLK